MLRRFPAIGRCGSISRGTDISRTETPAALSATNDAAPAPTRIACAVETLRRASDGESWRHVIRTHYARLAGRYRGDRVPFYYRRLIARLKHVVPPGMRVLDIGCGQGHMLAALRPRHGVGVDLLDENVQRARTLHPHLNFRKMKAEDLDTANETFDYVIISQTLSEIYDVVALLRSVRRLCHDRTRLVIANYSRLWQPALRVAEWIGIKQPSPPQNWLPSAEIDNLLALAGWEPIRHFGTTLVPVGIPLVSKVCNRVVANLPLIDALCLNHITVARPVATGVLEHQPIESVSVVIPARNEAGHIQTLLSRIPQLAPKQEVIFVEGNSTDDTWAVIRDVVSKYRGSWTIRCLRQPGKGKADAVRTAFKICTGDVLMILDADISVPPEELTAFRDALACGHAEFVNGSRMVYLMDAKAMRFLNLLGNKFFGAVFTYLLSQRFRDTLCGTKVLRRSDYERIAAGREYFGDFDPFGDFDLLFGAARLNLKIADVPIHYKARTYGETNISRFSHGLILLRMCAFAARKIKFI